MKKFILIFIFVLTLFTLTGCSENVDQIFDPDPINLNVSAVTSMKNPLDELKNIFESENTDIILNFNYGTSQSLTNEVISGTIQPDIIIVSSNKNMQELENNNLIVLNTKENLVSNSLVLVAPLDSNITSIEELVDYDVYKIAVGNPEYNSSGHYAIEALTKLDLYYDIINKIVYENTTEEILTTVSHGGVDAAVVFKSDIITNPEIKLVTEFPSSSYNPIIYSMAELNHSNHNAQVRRLEEFLKSDQAISIFSSYGFNILS